MGAIHLVRHGQASFGAEDYDQLSPLGKEQSRLLGVWQRECGLSIDGIVTGSLKRHQQSAQACVDEFCRIPQADWTVNAGFDEFNHHEVLQRFIAELADQPEADLGFNRWMQHTRNCVSRRSVADEAKTEDLLHGKSESVDVGALAER